MMCFRKFALTETSFEFHNFETLRVFYSGLRYLKRQSISERVEWARTRDNKAYILVYGLQPKALNMNNNSEWCWQSKRHAPNVLPRKAYYWIWLFGCLSIWRACTLAALQIRFVNSLPLKLFCYKLNILLLRWTEMMSIVSKYDFRLRPLFNCDNMQQFSMLMLCLWNDHVNFHFKWID